MKPVQNVLDDGDLKKTEISEIVLVGGSTRIPKVQSLVKEFFNGKVCYSSRFIYYDILWFLFEVYLLFVSRVRLKL